MRAEAYLREAGPSHELSEEDLKLRAELQDAKKRFYEAMSDDFDTPKALSAIENVSAIASRIASESLSPNLAGEAAVTLRDYLQLLGFSVAEEAMPADLNRLVELLVDVRAALRRKKMWDLSDEIRSRLAELGIRLEDKGDQTVWWIER